MMFQHAFFLAPAIQSYFLFDGEDTTCGAVKFLNVTLPHVGEYFRHMEQDSHLIPKHSSL